MIENNNFLDLDEFNLELFNGLEEAAKELTNDLIESTYVPIIFSMQLICSVSFNNLYVINTCLNMLSM